MWLYIMKYRQLITKGQKIMSVFLDPLLKDLFPGGEKEIFEKAFALTGEEFRNVKNRRTLRFGYNGRNYFIKIHRGVGWKEIFKNLFQGKKPVLGARNEYEAIRLLESLNVPTMTCRAFAERGNDPAKKESFIVTDELQNVLSLEDFCRDWENNPPESVVKNRIIRCLAETCAKMHFAGLNHRDCYICHFLLDTQTFSKDQSVRLVVLDLHRAEIRKSIPRRMRIKDLAGIFFSSMDAGLNKKDALRFIAAYSKFGELDHKLWQDVLKTAIKLYRKEWKRDPDFL